MPMRINHSYNAAGTKRYLEVSDYLEADTNRFSKGRWFGKGAQLFGLEGDVDKAVFDRLVDNQHPFEDELLTQRQHANRRCGTDLTFTTPKSVSILWAETQDDAILQAVQRAAHDTLAELEKVAQTRVNHERGSMSLQKTGNLLGASFLHTTSRPVDGYPDPALHIHCYAVNATHTDGRWTAVDLSAVYRDSGLYEAIFQSKLAEQLKGLGYPVEPTSRDFEIAGFSRKTIDKFSRRTALIEAEAEARGITNALEKGQLGAKTRWRAPQKVIQRL
ncbi:MAG: MobF family relaxase [Planctomycetota bacterium]